MLYPAVSIFVIVLLALTCSLASAQAVALSGVLGGKALLVVGSNPPRAVAVGEAYQGVRVLSVGKDEAVVEVQDQRSTLQLGQAPVSVRGSSSSGQRVVLVADTRGHFVQQGQINGQPMSFMVDTGASTIAIGQAQAQRLGLDYRSGQPVRMNTANGVTQGWRLRLDSVRLGEVQITGLEAVITPQPMPHVLLGNNFLNYFQMTRTPDQMVLEKRR